MKRLIFLFMIVSLSGCAAVDAYLMTHFDPVEYRMITEIRYDAHNSIAECDDAVASKVNANNIAYKTGLYHAYESDIPHNEDSIKASLALDEMAQGLKTRYAGSEKINTLYCKLKFGGIESSATLIQHVQGKRPR